MKRVLVTGNAGAGKTTFAKLCADQISLPLQGLDAIVWKSGWVKSSEQERREKIEKLVAGERWIIDGVSSLALEAADTIVFIDLPLKRCLWNILKRFLSTGFGTRESLPSNCPEYIGVFKAMKVAFYYARKTRPWIVDLIHAHPEKKIFWCRSYDELRKVQDELRNLKCQLRQGAAVPT